MYRLSNKLFTYITDSYCNIYNCDKCQHKTSSVDCKGNEIDKIVNDQLHKLFIRFMMELKTTTGKDNYSYEELVTFIDNFLKKEQSK